MYELCSVQRHVKVSRKAIHVDRHGKSRHGMRHGKYYPKQRHINSVTESVAKCHEKVVMASVQRHVSKCVQNKNS